MSFACGTTFAGGPSFVLLVYARSTTPSGGAGIRTDASAWPPVGSSATRRMYVPGTGRADVFICLVYVPGAETENLATESSRFVVALRRLDCRFAADVVVKEKVTFPFA